MCKVTCLGLPTCSSLTHLPSSLTATWYSPCGFPASWFLKYARHENQQKLIQSKLCKVPRIEEVKLSQNYVSNVKQFGTKICLLPNKVTVYIQRQYIYTKTVWNVTFTGNFSMHHAQILLQCYLNSSRMLSWINIPCFKKSFLLLHKNI